MVFSSTYMVEQPTVSFPVGVTEKDVRAALLKYSKTDSNWLKTVGTGSRPTSFPLNVKL